jgi:hypothetical protein
MRKACAMMMGTKMAEEGKTRTKKNGTRWDEVWEDVGEVPGEGKMEWGTPIAGGERGDHGVGFAVQVKYMLL